MILFLHKTQTAFMDCNKLCFPSQSRPFNDSINDDNIIDKFDESSSAPEQQTIE